MNTLLHIAVINALTVLPLAVLAFGVGRWARRPALTHALWVLVLLKFVTPPLFNLPVTIELPVAANVRHASSLPPVSEHLEIATRAETIPADSPPVVKMVSAASSRESQHASSFLSTTLRKCSAYWARRPGVGSWLLGCWLAGAAWWAGLQIVRAIRFQRRVLRTAIVSVELQAQTQRLAERLGLRRVPQVLIVEATVSPMLWGCGSRATLLFPSDLAERLDDQARATLLTHELAHFGRGDHWVRLLELIATGLFWWHPVVWWARRQIEEAEEECCDAWVIGEFPDTPRQYAEALLDTIDFLCESRQALPPIASGLGQPYFLRRRLTKIMRGAAPKTLSHRCRCAIALVAVLILPLQPFVFGFSNLANLRLDSIPNFAADADTTTAWNAASSAADPANSQESSPGDDSSSASPNPPSARSRPRGEKVWSTAVSPDGRFVVQTTTARRVLLTDLSTNTETDLSEHRITAVAFAPDGTWFAAAGQDGRITLWDSARGEMLRTVLNHKDVLRSVAISPQGDTLAAGGRDGAVLVSDLGTGSVVHFPTYSSAVNCVRFSSDGRQLAVAVGDWMSNNPGEVALLDAATGRNIATLDCATSPGALAFASNDELIVGLWNGQTQLWNLVNRHIVGSALAHKNVVAAAAFSPDNPVLREVTFVAEEPTNSEDNSPLAMLRSLFTVPAK